MKELLDKLSFYEAELDSAIQYDNIRGQIMFNEKINNLKQEIKVMEELDKKLLFNLNVLIDNEIQEFPTINQLRAAYNKVSIKLAKQYATHCMEQQKIICAKKAECCDDAMVDVGYTITEAYVNKSSILNAPLYNGENYGN